MVHTVINAFPTYQCVAQAAMQEESNGGGKEEKASGKRICNARNQLEQL